MESLSDDFDPIWFVAERDLEVSLKEIDTTMSKYTPNASRAVTTRRVCAGKDASQL